jgi:transposase
MQVYIGIDWSESKHDIVIMNEAGAAIARQTVPHSPEGFLKLEDMCQNLEVSPADCLFGLETAHNIVIDFLWSRSYTNVYVIPPSVVKSTRGRYGQSRARTDQSDAFLLADLLRTDRHRLQPWHPDSLLTRQMRAKVSLINHLTRSVVRLSNRLRAVLLRYYPSALHVFSSLRTQIALQFIRAYPTPEAAKALAFAEFEAFARQHGYPQPKRLPKCFAHLQSPCPEATSETVLVYRDEAVQLAALLLSTVRAKNKALRELTVMFEQHPDRDIFASLPGAGKFLAPALLVKFGDDRQRFSSSAGVQALAGTCPVTDSSGKRRVVKFRRACDREFRNIVQKWAITSKPESLWATLYWEQVRPHCNSDSHAYRCLANRWLAIAWKLWQTGELYDEAYHLQQRALHSKPRQN